MINYTDLKERIAITNIFTTEERVALLQMVNFDQSMQSDEARGALPRILTLSACLAIDADGDEGLAAAPIGRMGQPIPLIAADQKREGQIRALGKIMARRFRMTTQLVRFNGREDIETYSP